MVSKRDYIDVGVMSGPAHQYADVIHNRKGTKWHNLGPGNKGTGRVIGDKFIDRAWDENEREIDSLYGKGFTKAVRDFNGDN